ncbi:MAG: phosphoribosylformylglycinamidine synthase subunit PurQ [Oscillatoriales cyanobacterium SM2_1_8]|nr:phosphoribosylformylglycinamidine synthase subunit PurQ [Oscillatoriales cyanobacterium SM2_1_8]
MNKPRFGVVVFPGSNCDRDAVYALRDILGCPTRMVWHRETDLSDLAALVLPGGFSYGDYLRCGAIARFAPLARSLREFAAAGKYVLGICNGFQILTEMGLLPGALIRNRDRRFRCETVPLHLEPNPSPWTAAYPQTAIALPIAHGEGCYYATAETLQELQNQRQILWRYGVNPNGSVADIAGICNRQGNVLGMMPHPERAVDPLLGNTDGLPLFQGLLACLQS